LAGHRQAVESAEDAQLLVQGDQVIERAAGSGGGEVGALAPPQGREDSLAILSKPEAFHGGTSSVHLILRLQ
jgi:hypothetical protein